jgi:hypothetical protein
MNLPTRAEVRAFGKTIQKGDRFLNRWQEHDHAPRTRLLEVVLDLRGTAFFALKDVHTGRTTVMRSRTLMRKYMRV